MTKSQSFTHSEGRERLAGSGRELAPTLLDVALRYCASKEGLTGNQGKLAPDESRIPDANDGVGETWWHHPKEE